MDNCTTVFIADNSEEFCSQLAAEMQKCQGFQIVGTATDGEQTLRALAELRPEVLAEIRGSINVFRDRRPELYRLDG